MDSFQIYMSYLTLKLRVGILTRQRFLEKLIGKHSTWRARMSLMTSGSECGCASTLLMTGILGVLIVVEARASL